MTSTIDRPSASRHNQDPDSQRKFLTPKRAIAGLLIGAGVVGGAAGGYNLLSNDEAKGTATSQGQEGIEDYPGDSNFTVERPAGMTAETATPDEFFSDQYFTDEERINWAYTKLNEANDLERPGMTVLEAAYDNLKRRHSDDGNSDGSYRGYQYVRDLVSPSEGMTGNEILTLHSVINEAATASNLPEDVRIKLLAATVDNSQHNLATLVENVKERDSQNMSGLREVVTNPANNLPVESPLFHYGVLNNGFDPAGIPTKVMNTMSTTDEAGSLRQLYFQFVDGKPILVKSVDSTNKTERASNPQNIPAN